MEWQEFKRQASSIAGAGEERLDRSGLILLGTLRKDGWPRISPVEPLVVDGKLYLGMIWRSLKALDLLRDQRCTVHSTVSNREGNEDEFKLYGRAIEILDLEERRCYSEALYKKIGWKPNEPHFHVFKIDIERAAFTIVEDGEMIVKRWIPSSGEEVVKRWKPDS